MNKPVRRRLVAALGLLPFASASVWAASARTLRFDHLHTGEKLEVDYFAGGNYVAEALASVNHLLRDFRGCVDGGRTAPIWPGVALRQEAACPR